MLFDYGVVAPGNRAGAAMPFSKALPGILAHRSSLSGSNPIEVPDLRDESARETCRGDRLRPDPSDPMRLIDG